MNLLVSEVRGICSLNSEFPRSLSGKSLQAHSVNLHNLYCLVGPPPPVWPGVKWYFREMDRVNQLAGSGEQVNSLASQPKTGLLSKIFMRLVNWWLQMP